MISLVKPVAPATEFPAPRWILPLVLAATAMALFTVQSPESSIAESADVRDAQPFDVSSAVEPAATADPEMKLVSAKINRTESQLSDRPSIQWDDLSEIPEAGSSEADTQLVASSRLDLSGVSGTQVSYTRYQVMQWAYQNSPEANMIDQEIRSVSCGVDCDDEDAMCQLRLIKSVLAEIALGRRADDAAEAAKAYDRLIAAQDGIEIAGEGLRVQDRLIDLANEADRLGVPDGDVLQLQQAKLVWQDMQLQQNFATRKLRQELARRTGRPEAEVAIALIHEPLQTLESIGSVDAGLSVATALENRNDLKAVKKLCAGMRTCNVSSARQLMGAINPGVGLAIASAGAKGLLSCLHPDTSGRDLNCRRQQCSLLRESLSGVVRNETLQAVLDVRLAQSRLELIDQQLLWAQERLQEKQAAIDLDQQPVGSDDLIRLEMQRVRGDQLARRLDLSLAITEWKRVQGIVQQSRRSGVLP
nr:hypothetical protein [Rhodopirellula sp. JC740]